VIRILGGREGSEVEEKYEENGSWFISVADSSCPLLTEGPDKSAE